MYTFLFIGDDDTPYLVVNAPDNLAEMLEGWEGAGVPVNVWLKSKGVEIYGSDEVNIISLQ